MLTQVAYKDAYGKRMQTGFGGMVHTPACRDGELYYSENLTSDFLPVLATRQRRGLFRTLEKANGLAGRDVLMWVDGTEFFYAGEVKGTVTDSRKAFYFIGPWVIIWPDKAFYNVLTDTFGSLEVTYISGAGQISFQDGTYADVPAKANCIVTTGDAFAFEVGDAVTITGCSVTANNTTPIIREISDDKKALRFYENSFKIASGTSYTEAGAITIKRAVPDMDFLCQNENRLWGCKGDDIYCSKLGNPKVWLDYDGLADGSWAVPVGSEGDFTGCASFISYPIFFKENRIYKVYGTKPSDFQAVDSAREGVLDGCAGSLAMAGETLIYRGRNGIMRYSGGYPYPVGAELGTLLPAGACAGSDGRRYYISGETATGESVLLCFDTLSKTWMREDGTRAQAFANTSDGLYYLSGNEIWKIEHAEGCTAEETLTSIAEFGDALAGSTQKKNLNGLQLLAEVEAGGELEVQISFDGGDYRTLGTLTGEKKLHELPIMNGRGSFWRVRLLGKGRWKLWALSTEYATGSTEK